MLTQKLNIYDTNLGQVMRYIAGPPKVKTTGPDKRFATFDVVPIKYEIKLSDQAYKVLQSNPLLKQQIQLDMIKLGQEIVKTNIVMKMKRGGQPVDAALKLLVEQGLKAGEVEVNKLIGRVLDRHAEMNKAWGDYYKGMRKDLIFVAVGIGLSVASIALAVPTGGASLALTIAGGARAIAGAVNKLGDCWRTAEEQHGRVRRSIDVLLAAYKRSVHQGRGMQIGGALMDSTGILPVIEMLPFVRQQLMPSVTKIRADMNIYKGKLGSLYEAANKLAAQLFELLDRIDEWKKQNPGAEMPKLAKIEGQIEDLLDSGVRKLRFRKKLTISGAYEAYDKGMKENTELEKQFKEFENVERHPRAVAIISAGIKVLGNLAYAGGGYGASVPTFDSTSDILSISSTIANDVIGTVNDFVEFGQTAKGDASASQVQQSAQQFEATFGAIPVTLPPPTTGRAPPPTGKYVPRPGIVKPSTTVQPRIPTTSSGPRRLAPVRPGP